MCAAIAVPAAPCARATAVKSKPLAANLVEEAPASTSLFAALAMDSVACRPRNSRATRARRARKARAVVARPPQEPMYVLPSPRKALEDKVLEVLRQGSFATTVGTVDSLPAICSHSSDNSVDGTSSCGEECQG